MPSAKKEVDGFVRAKGVGYDGIDIRQPGEVFRYKGLLGSWMEEVDATAPSPAPEVRSEPEKPVPLSKAARQQLTGKAE